MSRRGEIVSEIVARMAALGRFVTVVRWRDSSAEPFSVEECPALNVMDGNAAVTHQVSIDEHALEVKFDVVRAQGVPAADVEDDLSAVAASIMTDEYWSGLADGTNIESHDIDTSAEKADSVTCGQLKSTVNYTTPKGEL